MTCLPVKLLFVLHPHVLSKGVVILVRVPVDDHILADDAGAGTAATRVLHGCHSDPKPATEEGSNYRRADSSFPASAQAQPKGSEAAPAFGGSRQPCPDCSRALRSQQGTVSEAPFPLCADSRDKLISQTEPHQSQAPRPMKSDRKKQEAHILASRKIFKATFKRRTCFPKHF